MINLDFFFFVNFLLFFCICKKFRQIQVAENGKFYFQANTVDLNFTGNFVLIDTSFVTDLSLLESLQIKSFDQRKENLKKNNILLLEMRYSET